MLNIVRQIVNQINNDNCLNLVNANWHELMTAVQEEGVTKHSHVEEIKDTIIDLFDSVGYNEFGITDND